MTRHIFRKTQNKKNVPAIFSKKKRKNLKNIHNFFFKNHKFLKMNGQIFEKN